MAQVSDSTASQLQRNNLAVSGAKAHAKELPPSAVGIAASLEKREATINKLNADQEVARTALKTATVALTAELKAATAERQKLIRFAEATFGPRAPQIGEFRSKVDGAI